MLFTRNLDPIANLLGDWASELGLGSILLRLALSCLFASIIGCERAKKRHSAGLRTFLLVGLFSTMAILLDVYLAGQAQFPVISASTVISIAITSSYSILYSSKNQLKGLTTAVGLWACGILGLVVGSGLYTLSVIGFLMLFCCLSLLPSLEIYLQDRSAHFEIHLELQEKRSLPQFITTLRRLGLAIDDIETNPAYLDSGLSVFTISLTIIGKELQQYKKHSEIVEALDTLEYVSHIEEIK